MLKLIIHTLLVSIILFGYNISYSYENESGILTDGKTIKENIIEIKKISEQNSNLAKELISLNTDYRLKTYLKKSLTSIDIANIKELIYIYNNSTTNLEKELNKNISIGFQGINEKKKLLQVKKNFYNKLSIYIDSKHKNKYLEYIKSDTLIIKKQRELNTDLSAKREILNNKVQLLETKIQEHRVFINKNIKLIIEKKLDEKINQLNRNQTFLKLNTKSKRKVLDKTISKISIKLKILQNNTIIKSNGLNKKVQTYKIAVEKLQIFRNNIK